MWDYTSIPSVETIPGKLFWGGVLGIVSAGMFCAAAYQTAARIILRK